MTRHLYRLLLRLLPCWFREAYAEEMLWIFDQTAGNRVLLVLDVAWAVARQWLGSALWWQCLLVTGTAPLPYLFGLQVWKDLKETPGKSQPGVEEIALVVVAFLICLAGVVWVRRATAQTICQLGLRSSV